MRHVGKEGGFGLIGISCFPCSLLKLSVALNSFCKIRHYNNETDHIIIVIVYLADRQTAVNPVIGTNSINILFDILKIKYLIRIDLKHILNSDILFNFFNSKKGSAGIIKNS